MLTPIGKPLPQELQDRGHQTLDALQGLRLEQQLNLACRTLLAVLLLRRPPPSAPKGKRDAFKTLCNEVQVWLKDEIAELRRAQPTRKTTAPKRKPRQGWACGKRFAWRPLALTTNPCGSASTPTQLGTIGQPRSSVMMSPHLDQAHSQA